MFSRRSARLQRQRLQRQVKDVVDIAVRARHSKRVSRRALVRQDRVGTQAASSHVCPLSPAAV
eukprot:2230115-Prymnesium_polylepis.1